MEFLYPKSQQFPFDIICTEIVRQLERRNWQVAGFELAFDTYGTGDRKFRLLRTIRTRDARIRFGRPQGRIDGTHWNDTAAVSDIVIPKKELHVYDDESGPTFYLYVGNDWEKDRERFMNGSKVNSKLDGEPRTYLQYSGAALIDGHRFYLHRRQPYLVHTNDLGREYDREGEPEFFETKKVLQDFAAYLEMMLGHIIGCRIPNEIIDGFPEPAAIPMPAIGSLFCFGSYDDAMRVRKGAKSSELLEPPDRYGMQGNGWRLVAYGDSDGNIPQIAHEGFLWCGIGEVDAHTPKKSLLIPGGHWSSRDEFVFRVKPNRANDIYVADHAAYEKRRQELIDANPGSERFTQDQVRDFVSARGRTIVPLAEYMGGYEQPIVLVQRELSLDEVELVSASCDR